MIDDGPAANPFVFCPVLMELLLSGQTVGKSGKVFSDVGALSTRNNLLTLHRLFVETKPERTLEIGLSFGGSALLFTSAHRALGRLPASQHMALDPYQETVWDSTGIMAVERAGLGGYLDFRSAFSAFELPRMIERGDRFGLVYVDGSHLFEDAFVDAYFVLRLLTQGGIVAFDDSSTKGVGKVIRFIRSNMRPSLAEVDLSPYRNDSKTSLPYRLARHLGKIQLTAFRRVGSVAREWNARFVDF